jgi:hypothetical protein
LNISRHVVRHSRLLDLALINPNQIVVDRTGIHECVVIHHGHAVVHALVHIRHIRDMIHGHVVVNVRNLYVRHTCVGNVYVLHVARAGPIPRYKHFSRAKREPADTASHADPNAKTTTPDECDQGW